MRKVCRGGDPLIDIAAEGVRHRVWRLADTRVIRKIEAFMARKDIFIADGHHRYEVARTYALEVRDKSNDALLKRNARFMMAYFVESDERILTILPAHRLIKDIGTLKRDEIKKRLSKFFYMERSPNVKSLIPRLRGLSPSHAFGMYTGVDDFCILKLKSTACSDRFIVNNSRAWKRLDVTILHLFILEYALGIRDEDDNVEFAKDVKDVVRLVDSGEFKLAFFLNPTRVSQVKRIANLGERMPRKATYFYPKPLSGLVINKLG